MPREAGFAELIGRYQEPHRAYHTDQHLRECLQWLDELAGAVTEPLALGMAIWYHDAIYWPRRSDNEQASADLATAHLGSAGADPRFIDTVAALIMVTAHQAAPPPGDPAVLVDIDLAILGAAPERFAEYEVQIRKEYAWVPEFLFRRKRAEVLQGFMRRPRLYSTPVMFDRLESNARANLSRAINALRHPRR